MPQLLGHRRLLVGVDGGGPLRSLHRGNGQFAAARGEHPVGCCVVVLTVA
ncbi:hypothetical protein ACFYXH_41395 [Streptomyces sp. NPDC002730]